MRFVCTCAALGLPPRTVHSGGTDRRTFAVRCSFEAAAALGNATAQFAIGVAQSLGAWGFPRDEATAILNMYFAALGGDTQAQLAMGYRY